MGIPVSLEALYQLGGYRAGEDAVQASEPTPNPMCRAGIMAGLGLGAAIMAQGCAKPPLNPPDPYPDVPPPKLDPLLRRLIERSTFGLNAREGELAESLGYDAYLEHHLNYTEIDNSDVDEEIARIGSLNLSPRQVAIRINLMNFQSVYDFAQATFVRSAYSTRQLYERMVEFWTNHFNIFIQKDGEAFLKHLDDRDVIRAHAMTSFPQLLSASAHSPAMLYYLDNFISVAENPNQNYARELLELHTVGVDNFTQEDVLEVARCFTGWTLNQNQESNDFGSFYFDSAIHDTGAKTVFGHAIPAGGGQQDGERVLEILASDPIVSRLTATHIGRKLAVQFWGYDPPESLVNDIRDAYLRSGGDIREMIRAALNEQHLKDAPMKLKRPYHLLLSALRCRPSDIVDPNIFMYLLDVMGNMPYNWAPPNGYPDTKEYWGQQLMSRWSILTLLALQEDIAPMDLNRFMVDMTAEEFVEEINTFFFNGNMPPDHFDVVLDYISDKMQNPYLRREAVGLALGSAAFQWY